ncbi:oligoribonuclease [Marinomonas ostreistagni]|uniref:oligoribonuclease n=1 Tax=Marinomonas ostreistagni TaxID=359209 RepID=UPI001951E9DB|nr:oligoribonuclease [Marinomonas ostreistagni]MBM6549717.1 oligoribonuclease [Marinomonas ostreistagni]
MSYSEDNLIWIDLEMTGLEPETDTIIEIATIVTDKDLNVLGKGPNLAIHQSKATMDAMDEWCTTHHGQSGLTERVLTSEISMADAEAQTIAFLEQFVPAGKSPICGNSVGQDRRFLYRYMPKLEAFFHYRYLDVSTVKELAKRWKPEALEGFEKSGAHLALDDIIESIEELKHYRKTMFGLDD